MVTTATSLITQGNTAVEKARFELMMRKWRNTLLNDRILNASLQAQKNFVNAWLADFEKIFTDQQSKINILSGYTGFLTASTGAGVATSIDAYLDQYKSTVTALSSKDLVQARGLRNSLALRVKREGVANIYSSFEAFDKEARALGLTGRERTEGFLNTLGKDYTTIMTKSKTGRIMRWKPDKYARMYSNTRDSQLRDELFQDQLISVGSDIVQVSNHNTSTPICKQFEGKVFSLTGETAGLPPLLQRPPFHPNCKHVLVSRPKLSMRDARKNNFFKDKDIRKENYTDRQRKAMKKQMAWNNENRPAKALQV